MLLLVEVADSSVGYDRRTKLPFYAAAGIRELWIVNLQHDRVESYTEPAADSYRVACRYRLGESVAPAAFPDLHIAVAQIIPGRSPT